ncbi:MAG: tRNA (adenosine(37)-N6)-threonylcarbamoyltransferase complex ATPase subunit type 1 TsaE [bacterium]|nr:tRNA (adenosine(37)-N6)-threonylcarbamoyltransferase complex ATPase subunit type 1 TsaE [bacterium]
MNTLKIITKSTQETKNIGKKLSKFLKIGDILILVGDLGSGKTTFVQGIAKGLQINNRVYSPSFTIINEYPKKIPLYHIDLYRLDKIEEILSVGIEEYLWGNGIAIIEWGEKIKELIDSYMEINFCFIKENIRSLEFFLYGKGFNLKELESYLQKS